jgi:hypothetical protein
MRKAVASATIRSSSSVRVDLRGSLRLLGNASAMVDATVISEGRTSARRATLQE